MGKVIGILEKHPLIGKWRSSVEDARTEYTIYINDNTIRVDGIDFEDGEKFIISNVQYDNNSVEFDTLMPSTNRSGHMKLTISGSSGVANMIFTFIEFSVAIKCSERPNPEISVRPDGA